MPRGGATAYGSLWSANHATIRAVDTRKSIYDSIFDCRFDFRLSICSSIRFLNVDLLYDSIFRSHLRCNLITWAARASFRALLEVLERYCDSERAEICTAIQRARALRSELEHKDSERYIIQ